MYGNTDDLPLAHSLRIYFPLRPSIIWPIDPMQPPRQRHIAPLAMPILRPLCPLEPPLDRCVRRCVPV